MRVLFLVLAAAFTMHVHARDVWVVNGRSATLVRDCAVIAWDADAVFHNRAPFCEAGTLLAETTATVAANSVTQIRLDPPPCSIYNARGEWVKRTTITVDQPSLTFVSVLSNEAPPGVTAAVASP